MKNKSDLRQPLPQLPNNTQDLLDNGRINCTYCGKHHATLDIWIDTPNNQDVIIDGYTCFRCLMKFNYEV